MRWTFDPPRPLPQLWKSIRSGPTGSSASTLLKCGPSVQIDNLGEAVRIPSPACFSIKVSARSQATVLLVLGLTGCGGAPHPIDETVSEILDHEPVRSRVTKTNAVLIKFRDDHPLRCGGC